MIPSSLEHTSAQSMSPILNSPCLKVSCSPTVQVTIHSTSVACRSAARQCHVLVSGPARTGRNTWLLSLCWQSNITAAVFTNSVKCRLDSSRHVPPAPSCAEALRRRSPPSPRGRGPPELREIDAQKSFSHTAPSPRTENTVYLDIRPMSTHEIGCSRSLGVSAQIPSHTL